MGHAQLGRGRAEADGAVASQPGVHQGQFALEFTLLIQQALGFGQQGQAEAAGLKPAFAAIEQGHAQFLGQRGQAAAQGRLGQVAMLGRPLHRSLLAHRQKVLQLAAFHA